MLSYAFVCLLSLCGRSLIEGFTPVSYTHLRDQEVELRRIELERKRTTLEAQIAVLRAEFAVEEIASVKIIGQEKAEKAQLVQGRVDMGLSRNADVTANKQKRGSK